jgi:hypothetical protein
LAAATRVVCLTVRFVAVVVGVAVSAAGSELVSIVAGAVSVVGAGVGVTVVDGSVVTGCVCCAPSGVDESARAAAIADRALVDAYFVAFLIMLENCCGGISAARLSPACLVTATNGICFKYLIFR